MKDKKACVAGDAANVALREGGEDGKADGGMDDAAYDMMMGNYSSHLFKLFASDDERRDSADVLNDSDDPDECHIIEEENRMLGQQWVSHEMIDSELQRLLGGKHPNLHHT